MYQYSELCLICIHDVKGLMDHIFDNDILITNAFNLSIDCLFQTMNSHGNFIFQKKKYL